MRVSFLVDGFNLYHSLRRAQTARSDGSYRWLDLRSLLAGYLENVDRAAFLGEIAYESAIATHLQEASPGIVQRHRSYIEALRTIGVRIELGHYKRNYMQARLRAWSSDRRPSTATAARASSARRRPRSADWTSGLGCKQFVHY